MLRFIMMILAAGCLIGAASAQTVRGLPKLIIPDGFGVNIHFVEPNPTEADLLAAGGTRFIRMDFAWSGIERKRGEYDFSGYDKLVEGMTKRGVRLLFILDYGNDLYSAKGEFPRTPEALGAFAKWAAAAAKHYAGKGILWEIFNEPNIGFWKPAPSVDEYSKLSLTIIPAIREADPEAFIVAPASSGFPWDFFEGMGERGVWNKLDAVSVHPYRGNEPETAAIDYRQLRTLLDRFCPEKKLPIISGEWGYSTQQGGLPEETQAQYLVRQRLTNLANDVSISIWYDWHDDGPDPKYNEHHFGTVYQNFKPKPSYIVGQTLAKTLEGYAFVRRIALPNESDYALILRKGGDVALALWTTDPAAHDVTLPLPPGEARIVEMLGAQRAANIDAAGLKLSLSRSPQYLLLPQSEAALRLACWAPAETSIALRAGVDGTLPVRVANPTDQPLTGSLRLTGDLSGTAPVQVAAGAEATLQVPLRFARRDREQVAGAVEFVGAAPQPLQATPVTVSVLNPLLLRILPPALDMVQVMIANPSGEALRMTLRVKHGDASFQGPVVFPQGRTELDYSFHVAGGVPIPDGTPISMSVTDDAGKLVLEAGPVIWRSIAPVKPGDVWRAWTEGDAKVAGSAAVSVVTAPETVPQPDQSVLQLDHRFAPGWRFACWAPPENMTSIEGKPKAVGMWLYGDGSGNLLRCRITDSTGQTFQPHFGGVTWKGWRFVTLNLDAHGSGHWGGADDGVIHYPIHWTTLVLIDPTEENDNKDLRLYATGFALQY